MLIGTVVGTVVSSTKDQGLTFPLKLVQITDKNGNKKDNFLVVLDPLGAGYGEFVLVSQGSATRQTLFTDNKPIDALIVGIIDLIEEEHKIVYRK
jgi:microcompartment protein CcmK/EutM